MLTRKILLLNGPNLDMLGMREPEVYGHDTLSTLEQTVRMHAEGRGAQLTCFQSNSEGKLIGKIHSAAGTYDGIVYNPGAHTHYSYALRDAVASIDVPVVEVHLSAIDKREAFRQVSVIAPACVAQVKGLGVSGYCQAVDLLLDSADLQRLGEGYEKRVDPSARVVVADADGVRALVMRDRENPAAEYFDEIASADLAALSSQRRMAVRDAATRLGVDALLVRDTSNVRWACAFDGVFDTERAHGLLVSRDAATLHTDSRYSNAARCAAIAIGSDVTVDDSRASHAKFALEALSPGTHSAFTGKLGIEDTITLAEYTRACEVFAEGALVPTTDVVLGLRAVKDASELARMRAAQAITDAAFERIVGFIRPGMTEREVQLELEEYMLRHGADGLAFGSIVACGANGADPHAIPGETRLEAGQCVVMDFGARAFGYCSDMTRMVFLGKPEGEMAAAWDVLRHANEAVEEMLRPGVTGRQAHELAERVLEEGGFGGKMGHGLGHGVGLDCHELPVLNTRNDAPLVEGNVVTVEPGIYLPGKFGMRLEDCGVITADGYEVFSKLGHEMVVV